MYFQNYEEAQQVGTQSAKEIKSLLSPRTVGKKIRNRLEFILNTSAASQLSSQYLSLQAERDWLAYPNSSLEANSTKNANRTKTFAVSTVMYFSIITSKEDMIGDVK
jgi:hypothetical protein